jgi:hypothetical protein
MPDTLISCPKCHHEFKLTESLAQPLLEASRLEYERKLAASETEMAKRESALADQREALEKAQSALQEQVDERVKAERKAIATEEARKAKLLLSTDLEAKTKEVADLQQVLSDRETKLAEAQKAQAELIRKQRELDDAKREMDLTIETRVQESLISVRNKARLEAEESLKLKVAEREETISAMQKQIEELKRKSEQGSQQLQGEALELELESTLRCNFPVDTIEPVPKGKFGGDILHRVVNTAGQVCGTILWEAKRAKNWSDGWLPKLRGDQRAAHAETAILISFALPPNVESFSHVDGIWVAHLRCIVPMAMILRQSLLEIAAARTASQGQQTKMELVYNYLTGPRFKHRVEAIVELFTKMQADLEQERRALTRSWAKREAQIRGVIESTAGLYGDLQGIAGRSMGQIDGIDFPQLPEGDPS